MMRQRLDGSSGSLLDEKTWVSPNLLLLQAAGKAVKLALTACARKLLTILNAMEKYGKNYVK